MQGNYQSRKAQFQAACSVTKQRVLVLLAIRLADFMFLLTISVGPCHYPKIKNRNNVLSESRNGANEK
jgi:hypothetical protein